MSEGTVPSESASESAKPESLSPPPGKGKKMWITVIAVVVVIALIATAFAVMMGGEEEELTGKILGGDEIQVDAGRTAQLSAVVHFGDENVTNSADVKYLWSVSPANLGAFSLRARPTVPFRADIVAGTGTLTCQVTYTNQTRGIEKSLTLTKPIRVLPPFLDAISIFPSVKTIEPGASYSFRATAVSSVALPIAGLEYTWSVSGMPEGSYTLNSTTGQSVTLTAGTTLGQLTLSATATYAGVTKTGSANVTIGYLPPRSVDYYWYDMFNVPFGEWWDWRWSYYHAEEIQSREYPYWYKYHSSPPGHYWSYTNMRLNITGRNVSEINMNDRPEFLPFLSPIERGGTAVIDWYMQYLTEEEMKRYPAATSAWLDGWVVSLNGTVTLDKQAAKAVLNLTDYGYDNFEEWWADHSTEVNDKYSAWVVKEAGPGRLDILPMYETPLGLFTFTITAAKVGSKIVLTYDTVSWGMDALITRWMRESFMPTEWYFEDMHFRIKIEPEWATIDIDTAVAYAAFATEAVEQRNKGERGYPTWAWQAMMQDYVPSSLTNPISMFDAYVENEFPCYFPGSIMYGSMVPYDITPGAWNLTENETLTLTWPEGYQLVRYNTGIGTAVNVTDDVLIVNYSEPSPTDFPGQIVIDNVNRTITFKGPIDMWTWSKTQTSHSFLKSEWDRLGLLPYGIPYVEFRKATPVVLRLDHFDIDMLDAVPADDLVTIKVTAKDQYNNVLESYNGTVNFTSSDPDAVLPANYTFKPAIDKGVHTFVAAVSFKTAGTQLLRVVNVSAELPLKEGNKTVTVLAKRNIGSFQVDVYHMPAVGVPEDVTVTAYDQYGDVFLNYTGTVTFSTNRTGQVTMPADYTFVISEHGVHKFAAGLTFQSEGWFTVTVADTANASATGSQTDINVVPLPEVIDHFTVTGIIDMLTKQRSDVTVKAYNQYGTVFERYTGTIHFTSNATLADLPDDYTFSESDKGVKVFTKGVSFYSEGVYNVTVYDVATPSARGSQENIVVLYKPAEQTFRMYDMFQQPWGEWWPWRYPAYSTDIILNNEPGKYTMLYNADKKGYNGIIFAPYRWNNTGKNMSTVNVHDPEFMPVFGPRYVPNAQAKLDIYFEYLSWDWWNSYWKPYWQFSDNIMKAQTADGYYLGVVITATMNRAAAYEWLNLPMDVTSPLGWWSANKATYLQKWLDWIMYEGNVRLDIWPGYEWPYSDIGTNAKLSVLPNGDIKLEIGHISWGYEVLMTRWLNETMLCNHEPYYEDFTMHADLYGQWMDFTYDAVCQYSLKAVIANASGPFIWDPLHPDYTAYPGAWAWDPLFIDYVATADTPGGLHKSKYDPWDARNDVYYISNNAGDPGFGEYVIYDSGKQYFNLSDYQKFIIQLPTGNDVLGYYAKRMPADAIKNLVVYGNLTPYAEIMYNGTMELGFFDTGGVDLRSMYDPASNTITMVGPLHFDVWHFANGALYTGAPYIEFNVTVPAGGTSLPMPDEPAALAPGSAAAELTALAVVLAAAAVATVALALCARRKV